MKTLSILKKNQNIDIKLKRKNGELKNVHGYWRAISYGIENMQMQGVLGIFAVNLKRILKLS